MKHILIYLLIALALFLLLTFLFPAGRPPDAEVTDPADGRDPETAETGKVGILFSGADDLWKVEFKNALERGLDGRAELVAKDYGENPGTFLTYFKKLLKDGCGCLILEVAPRASVDELLALAKEAGSTLFLYGCALTREQADFYGNAYTIGFGETHRAETLAGVLAGYWHTNERELDSRKRDGILYYSVVSDSGYQDTDFRKELEALAAERGLKMELREDVVTRYLNYNFEYPLDRIYFSLSEAILFADSADAEKAYHYYHDPSEYTKGPPDIYFCVMEDDETALSLCEGNQILFASGNGGTNLGAMVLRMMRALQEGEPLNHATVGVTPRDNGRNFLCAETAHRTVIRTEEEAS